MKDAVIRITKGLYSVRRTKLLIWPEQRQNHKELKLTELADYWWAVQRSRLTDYRWQRSGSCPETPCWIWVGHISLHMQVPQHTNAQRAPAPSVFDMGELNDRGRKAKEKASSVSLSLPSFSLPPSPPSLTAQSNIKVPYGALWTDFLKLVSAWHTINKTSRCSHLHTSGTI